MLCVARFVVSFSIFFFYYFAVDLLLLAIFFPLQSYHNNKKWNYLVAVTTAVCHPVWCLCISLSLSLYLCLVMSAFVRVFVCVHIRCIVFVPNFYGNQLNFSKIPLIPRHRRITLLSTGLKVNSFSNIKYVRWVTHTQRTKQIRN